MLSKKKLLSEYNSKASRYNDRHEDVQKRMDNHRSATSDLKKMYFEKTSSLNRLRNK